MNLSKENYLNLKRCMENKTILKVVGRNGLGQPFTSTGCVMPGTDNKGKPLYITKDGIALYVGQKCEFNNETFKLFVPCYYNLADIDESNLYIESISIADCGSVIYKNDNFLNQLTKGISKLKTKPYISQYLNIPMSDTANELLKLIGKPIIYRNQPVVATRVHMLSETNTSIDTTNGRTFMGLPNMTPNQVCIDTQAQIELYNYSGTEIIR